MTYSSHIIYVDTLKRKNSQISFQLVWTISNLWTFTKDKSQTSWRPVFAHLWGTKQRVGLYWSSEVDSKLRLPMKRPKQSYEARSDQTHSFAWAQKRASFAKRPKLLASHKAPISPAECYFKASLEALSPASLEGVVQLCPELNS